MHKTYKNFILNKGYTLVEVLVSSMIFTLSVGMVSSMIWKGTELPAGAVHRRFLP
jgi:prepilin-type N-terminal cleavage/methylation domain-containing protein